MEDGAGRSCCSVGFWFSISRGENSFRRLFPKLLSAGEANLGARSSPSPSSLPPKPTLQQVTCSYKSYCNAKIVRYIQIELGLSSYMAISKHSTMNLHPCPMFGTALGSTDIIG